MASAIKLTSAWNRGSRGAVSCLIHNALGLPHAHRGQHRRMTNLHCTDPNSGLAVWSINRKDAGRCNSQFVNKKLPKAPSGNNRTAGFVWRGIPCRLLAGYQFGMIDKQAIRRRFEALAPMLNEQNGGALRPPRRWRPALVVSRRSCVQPEWLEVRSAAASRDRMERRRRLRDRLA